MSSVPYQYSAADLNQDLISHLSQSLPNLPDTMIETLTAQYGLTTNDAGTLLSLEDGDRLDYFFDVVSRLQEFDLSEVDQAQLGRVTGNWSVTDRNLWALANLN
jgi:aspartyl-tRNA(Asn)/glutamyl-tRNA(Gln) amidotransferase subunit B